MYIRIELENVPCELVLHFDPHYPIVLGGLGNTEGNVGYVQVCYVLAGFLTRIDKERQKFSLSTRVRLLGVGAHQPVLSEDAFVAMWWHSA